MWASCIKSSKINGHQDGSTILCNMSTQVTHPPSPMLFLLEVSKSWCQQTGVWQLNAQKPLKKPGWWKGNFALFWMLATGRWGEGRRLSKGQLPLQTVGKSFQRQREGTMCRNSRQLWQSSWSGSPVVWPASWLFQVQLIFSSRLACFHFLEASCQNCGSLGHSSGDPAVNFFHLVGVSVFIIQLSGCGWEYSLSPLRRN